LSRSPPPAVAHLILVRSMRPVLCLTALLLLCAARRPTDLTFGEYYPHTRWIDRDTRSITVDAFTDRLVILQRGKSAVTIAGCWRGRAFLRDCKSDYFGVAHEGVDAEFSDGPFKEHYFRRVRPDPT
jgi:hypothetical protein